MKKILLLILLLPCTLYLSAQEGNPEYFYYYKDKKMPLTVDYSYITVVTEGAMPVTQKSAVAFNVENTSKSYTENHVILTENKKSKTISEEVFFSGVKLSEKVSPAEYNNLISNLKEMPNVLHVMPAFVSGEGRTGISNNFYVCLHKAEDVNLLSDLADKYAIEVCGHNKFRPLSYTLSCNKASLLNSIEAANVFYETGFFEYAEPELLYKIQPHSNDELYFKQWALKNTGQVGGTSGIDINVERAWNITKGAGVKVAIYDNGIQLDHPDLQTNIYGTGYDVMIGTSPSQMYGPHGTQCAGIVGAIQNNSIGISGVAPECKLMSISKNNNTYDITSQQIASGFDFAWRNGADIISCSWGLDYYDYPSSELDKAISDALTYGRNRKGTVIVFASGNYDLLPIPYPQNSNPLFLVVGSINPDIERAYNSGPYISDSYGTVQGSRYGDQLDVMAPGVRIASTSWYSLYSQFTEEPDGKIVGGLNGTSFACPYVAGIVALILSVRPELTVREVSNIIESTARKVGDYTYQTTLDRTNGSWNNEMGYGLVDAYAAVMADPCPFTRHTNKTVISSTMVTGCRVLIKDVTIRNRTISFPGNIPMELYTKLTVRAEREVVIESGFEVKAGSTLEILVGL